jgi:hypothetical protein
MDKLREAALKEFTEWFVTNYPGPHTIIHSPTWHAPNIFRAVEASLHQQTPAVGEPLEIWCPKCKHHMKVDCGQPDTPPTPLASLPAAAGPTERTHLSAEPIAASAPSSLSVGIGPKQKCPRCGEPRACYSCGVMFEDDLGLNDAVAMTLPAPQQLREPGESVTRPTPAMRPNEIDIVKRILSAYQTAYAQAHCAERKTVIESDGIAIGYASVELAKLLAGERGERA